MAKSATYLLVASTEAYSGKSATILGLTYLSLKQQITVAYGKPLGNSLNSNSSQIAEEDVNFLATTLGLSSQQVSSPLLCLDLHTINQRLKGEDTKDYSQALKEYVSQIEGDLVLLEGPGNLWEGSIFNLSVPEIAEEVNASILLVARYDSLLLVGSLLSAKKFLGDRLMGVIINDIPPSDLDTAENTIQPYLENQDIPVLGLIPHDSLLNSVSVREIAKRLEAKVLCCSDRLDWMVESLSIGAMNVNSALGFFRQLDNMAVVTGGDRTELQMAALETSTHCLILTGRIPPDPLILNRAEDLEIPILSVDKDTLTTVEIVDASFGKVPIHEKIKVDRIQSLMKQNFDFSRFMKILSLKSAISA